MLLVGHIDLYWIKQEEHVVQPSRLFSIHFQLLSVILFMYMLRLEMWKN